MMMKLAAVFVTLIGSAHAFCPRPLTAAASSFRLASTAVDASEQVMSTGAKDALLETAYRLKEDYGLFLVDAKAKSQLTAAVEDLESLAALESSSVADDEEMLLGDWTLVCTTATSIKGVDTSKIPFLQQGPLKQVRDQVLAAQNKYFAVQQLVKATAGDGVIDRIDHVIDYTPPSQLKDLAANLPAIDINPFKVSDSKVVLIHKAKMQNSDDSKLTTRLALTSVVLNVAGTSTKLDPKGADIAGINFPLGEFINAGTFETTYLDQDVRISRGKSGLLVDQLRVFVRTKKLKADEALEEIQTSDVDVGLGVDADMDVDESVDPEFASEEDEESTAPSDVETVMEADVDDDEDPDFSSEEPSDVEATDDIGDDSN